MKIFYPFSQSLATDTVYSQSILNFLDSLSRIADVELFAIDTKNDLLARWCAIGLEPIGLDGIYKRVSPRLMGINSTRFVFIPRVSRLLKRYCKSSKENVFVYTRDTKTLNGVMRSLESSGRVKFIFEAHQVRSDWFWGQGRIKAALKSKKEEEFLYAKTNLVFTLTEPLSARIKYLFGARVRTSTLPIGVRGDFFIEDKEKLNPDVIVYAGGLSRWKGVDVLIDAFYLLTKINPSARLCVVGGGGEKKKLEDRVKALGLESSIEFTGRVTNEEVLAYLRMAGIGVIPLTYQGDGVISTSPLKLYEYLAVGLQVVASRVPALTSAVPYEMINWFDPEDAQSLCDALYRCMENADQLRNKRIEFARDRTWEKRGFLVAQELNKIGN